jgi:uncharacterized protein (TIGR02246 family)
VSKDKDAIQATLFAMNAACATRDLAEFMALFDDSDDILFVGSDGGEVFHGKAPVRDFMAQLFGLPFTFSFDLANLTVHQDGDTAWAFVDGNMIHTIDKGSSAGKVRRMPYRFSIAMVNRGEGRWRWQLFHGSMPRAE